MKHAPRARPVRERLFERVKRKLANAGRKLARQAFEGGLADCGVDPGSTVLLVGSGRSGTTWLAEIINYRNEYRYMFEPFRRERVPMCRDFKPLQYLRPDNRDPALLQVAETILSGRIRNRWVDRHNKRLVSRRRLIKEIRTNLMLKWIHTNFPGVPIIFLLRHPCAVAYSRVLGEWDIHLEDCLSQKELVDDWLYPFKNTMEAARDAFDKQIFLWCIENYVPLQQFRSGEMQLVFYEHLCVDPVSEIKRLFAFLGKRFDDRVIAFSKDASPQTHSQSAILLGESLVDNWRRHVESNQLRKAVDILRLFGLDAVYSDESMPNAAGAHSILAK